MEQWVVKWEKKVEKGEEKEAQGVLEFEKDTGTESDMKEMFVKERV